VDSAPRHPESTHGVEDPQELQDGRGMTVVALELGITAAEASTLRAHLPIPVHRLGQLVLDQRVAGQQADPADHPHEAAGGVGAAAEPEDEDLVTGLVVQCQEAVGGRHMGEEPQPESAAQHAVQPVPVGAHSSDVLDELLHVGTFPAVGLDRARDLLDVRHVLVLGPVPGPVAADHESLHGVMVLATADIVHCPDARACGARVASVPVCGGYRHGCRW